MLFIVDCSCYTPVMQHERQRISQRARWLLASRQCFRCALCHTLFDAHTEVDHILPLAAGGSNVLLNLQMLCVPCHSRKTALEARARSGRMSALQCEWCGDQFSPHFIHQHLHTKKIGQHNQLK
jgi:5-methylcytosine-specific restriction endonuclease McrA